MSNIMCLCTNVPISRPHITEVGGGAIEVAIIEDPGRYVSSPRRLDVNRLNAIPGITASQKVFRFESIEELIGRASGPPD
jgi:hypothetical protein